MKPQFQLGMMIFLTGSFFFAEIIVGNITRSIALVADAFHMLSDLMAMFIALVAILLAKKKGTTKSNSFGWQRAEIVGGLVNGVFLLALCFTITLDAIERFFSPEEIENPKLLLIVGGVGLGINLVGLLIFSVGGHGHSHGGHGHSHGGDGHKEKKQKHGHSHSHGSSDHSHSHGDDEHDHDHDHDHGKSNESQKATEMKTIKPSTLQKGDRVIASKDRLAKKKTQLMFLKGEEILVLDRISETVYIGECQKVTGEFNIADVELEIAEEITHFEIDPQSVKIQIGEISKDRTPQKEGIRAVFLHIAGDALGSVAVIISALVSLYTDFAYKRYLDPALSLLIAGLITTSTVPLVKSTAITLLQGVQKFDFNGLKRKLLMIDGVKSVHELHVWKLADAKLIGSAHIITDNEDVGPDVTRVFHEFDIHSSTIQIEKSKSKKLSRSGSMSKMGLLSEDEPSAIETVLTNEELNCLSRCPPEICKESMCCPPEKP